MGGDLFDASFLSLSVNQLRSFSLDGD